MTTTITFQTHNKINDDIRPPPTAYIKTVYLNYERLTPIKSVHLDLIGIEKTCWSNVHGRSKTVYNGEEVLENH
ncbi:7826_t:CDS:2 [Entrophospora sp. SA101]|nr:7826_t:CDS:2 [Entrophospora sp. SA101]